MKNKPVFITGTDTNIGKTVLSLLVMAYCYKIGKTPFYLKPFQTGCTTPFDADSDAKFIYRNINQLKNKNLEKSVVYCLKNPKAPLYAALDDNTDISMERVYDIINEKSRLFDPVVIEGAGGLFVPVDKKTTIIDVIEKINPKVILAARAGLGTINHTLLSLEALKSRGVTNIAVVFINPKDQFASDNMIRENMEAVEIFSGIKVAGIINQIDDFSTVDEQSMSTIKTILT